MSGFLRSHKDNGTVTISSTSDLNKAGIIVGVIKGTGFDLWATNNLVKANIVRVSSLFDEAFPLVLKEQVHALVHDATDMFDWLNTTKSNCTGCFVKTFGELQSYGSFISRSITQVSHAHLVTFSIQWICLLAMLLIALL